MKKIVMSTMIIAIMVTSILGLVACSNAKHMEVKHSYVSLKINPEVDFAVDSNGNVASFYCVNENAEVLLSDIDLIGQTIEDASNKVVDLAIKAGYMDAYTEGKTIEVGAIDENGEEDTEMYEKLKKTLNLYFENNGIFGRVSKSTLDNYLSTAEELGLSLGHIKILMLACDRSGKTIEELKDKPINELMKIIHENNLEKLNDKNIEKKQQRKLAKEEKINKNSQKLKEHKNMFEKDKENKKILIKHWQES